MYHATNTKNCTIEFKHVLPGSPEAIAGETPGTYCRIAFGVPEVQIITRTILAEGDAYDSRLGNRMAFERAVALIPSKSRRAELWAGFLELQSFVPHIG